MLEPFINSIVVMNISYVGALLNNSGESGGSGRVDPTVQLFARWGYLL